MKPYHMQVDWYDIIQKYSKCSMCSTAERTKTHGLKMGMTADLHLSWSNLRLSFQDKWLSFQQMPQNNTFTFTVSDKSLCRL